jgi:hypothetical protein
MTPAIIFVALMFQPPGTTAAILTPVEHANIPGPTPKTGDVFIVNSSGSLTKLDLAQIKKAAFGCGVAYVVKLYGTTFALLPGTIKQAEEMRKEFDCVALEKIIGIGGTK